MHRRTGEIRSDRPRFDGASQRVRRLWANRLLVERLGYSADELRGAARDITARRAAETERGRLLAELAA